MKVEIWSDVVCPWCYIGKRRFETALAQFEHRDQVEVIWRSYQLDPTAPEVATQTVNEMLAQKYGLSLQEATAKNEQVSALAAQEGLEYHLEKASYGNTFDAHRLIHLAATHQLQDAMKERLLQAYFTEGKQTWNHEMLVELATEVGIDADEARATLESDAHANEVKGDIQRARSFGIRGVPFFAIDEQYGVSGAQSSEVLQSALEQAWASSHPLIQLGGTSEDSGGACDGDTCAVS
jgi:predicted DsbA family dithiol-disulfide isomerase